MNPGHCFNLFLDVIFQEQFHLLLIEYDCRWCKTDMSSWGGPKTALEGADTPLWLALRTPSQFVTGRFFGERMELDI
jgi:hypothetical protein